MGKKTVMGTRSKISILLWTICYAVTSVHCNPIAHVGESQIIGQRTQHSNMEANQFLGIPYAQPPVADLRFMPPKPLQSLQKLLKADRQPPACHQYTENPFPWYSNTTEKSEDCLYLNIWTPTDASPENTKAVLYWIHGGGFRYGSIRDEVYSGIPLAALGDIVVVTANYRLGPFGFLSSGTEDAPGNAGLWDILEGLRWVNENIQAFGGDPARITIAGESAGATAVAMLNISPLSKGLFARQIMQSGSLPVAELENKYEMNIRLTQNLAEHAGCANDTYTVTDHPSQVMQCLKDIDAITLSRMDSSILRHSRGDFSPQFGDQVMPTSAYKEKSNFEFCSPEVLIGVTNDEGSIFLTIMNSEVFGFFGHKDPQINKTTGKDLMRKMFSKFQDIEGLISHYLPDELSEDDYENVRNQVRTSLGDVIILCPSVYNAEKCAEKGNNVYYYVWKHRPSITPWAPWAGVAHFSEIQFVFGRPVLNPQQYQKEEQSISIKMIEKWSNFVKHGNPNKQWPLYSKEVPFFQYLGPTTEEQTHGIGPNRRNCDFLRPYYTN